MSTLNRIDESAINTSFYTLIGPSRSEEILVETLIGKVYSEKVCVIAYHCLRFTTKVNHTMFYVFDEAKCPFSIVTRSHGHFRSLARTRLLWYLLAVLLAMYCLLHHCKATCIPPVSVTAITPTL